MSTSTTEVSTYIGVLVNRGTNARTGASVQVAAGGRRLLRISDFSPDSQEQLSRWGRTNIPGGVQVYRKPQEGEYYLVEPSSGRQLINGHNWPDSDTSGSGNNNNQSGDSGPHAGGQPSSWNAFYGAQLGDLYRSSTELNTQRRPLPKISQMAVHKGRDGVRRATGATSASHTANRYHRTGVQPASSVVGPTRYGIPPMSSLQIGGVQKFRQPSMAWSARGTGTMRAAV